MYCYCWQSCKKWSMNDCDLMHGEVCPKLFKIQKIYEQALLTEKQRYAIQLRCENCDAKAYDKLSYIQNNILEFVNKGNNLFIYSSNTGNGKTEWALKLIRAYVNKIWSYSEMDCKILFVSVPKFLLALKENISEKSEYVEHIRKNVMKADIVVWDDIGTKTGTSFEVENLFMYIDSRINMGKSNIYTANMIPQQLSDCLGSRLASRIYGMSENIEFTGMDKRGCNQ